MSLFRKKPVEELLQTANNHQLSRALGALDLTLLGIGAIIGTGIFVLTGVAAAEHAGPALILSFVLAGLACVFAALCYAEFASTVPIAGSVYSYSYFTLGEIVAWLIGWDLILEYGLAVSAVAVGWSGYFQSLLNGFGLKLPVALSASPGSGTGAIFNLPAFCIIILMTFLLSRGVRESARVNNIMVFIKLAVVLVFIAVGVFYVKPANWTPFIPFGFDGVVTGAATIFFAYLGFDAVATAAEEVRNPKRDLPIGIIGSLAVCTALYIAVSAILTGMVPYDKLEVAAPVAFAMEFVGQSWFAGLISVGAICGITTVLLVMLYAQVRLFFAMSRDGLIPGIFSKVHPKYKTPYSSTWLTGLIIATISALVPLGTLAHLVNIGTLTAFILVSCAVLILRRTHPNLKRAFKCPAVPLVPILAILFCGYLMLSLPAITWKMFAIWIAIGIIVYGIYSRKHSLLGKQQGEQIKDIA